MPFRSALSGVNAAGQELKIIGNNVANASTVGFKQSRAIFADVYAATSSGATSNAIGAGVRLAGVNQLFTQGNVGFTDNKLDLAVNGKGFFILDDNGNQNYTRAGQFQADQFGYIVTANKDKLVVNKADENGVITGITGPLQLITSNISPKATTAIEVAVNLDSSEKKPASTPFSPDKPSSFTHSTSLTTYDSLGNSHLASLYFVKTDTPNKWDVFTFIDGKGAHGPADDKGQFKSDNIMFDGNGALSHINTVPVPPGKLTFPEFAMGSGADPVNFSLDFEGDVPITQFGGSFAVNNIKQDGFTSGRLTGIDISDTGVVSARFSNGKSRILGQVAIANFANANGLRQLGDTKWAESYDSGPALIGEPGTGNLGLIQSGALEDSNVDLTGQLVNMITAQRNFQASAQVISTADEVTQTVINIR